MPNQLPATDVAPALPQLDERAFTGWCLSLDLAARFSAVYICKLRHTGNLEQYTKPLCPLQQKRQPTALTYGERMRPKGLDVCLVFSHLAACPSCNMQW